MSHCVVVPSVFGGFVSLSLSELLASQCQVPAFGPFSSLMVVQFWPHTPNLRIPLPKSKHGCKFADLSPLIGSFERVASALVSSRVLAPSSCKDAIIPLLTSTSITLSIHSSFVLPMWIFDG